MFDLRYKLPVNGNFGHRGKNCITSIVIHHDHHESLTPYVGSERYEGHANFHIAKGFRRLSYHIRISRNGHRWHCNDYGEILKHSGSPEINLSSVAVCVDGNFDEHEPSEEQAESLWKTIDELRKEFPIENIWLHREVRPEPTTCPGDKLIKIIENDYARDNIDSA